MTGFEDMADRIVAVLTDRDVGVPHPRDHDPEGCAVRLCECGCGTPVKNRFAYQHYFRVWNKTAEGRRIAAESKRGPKNPNWKGDAAHTATKRARAVRVYDLGGCEECGKPACDRHHRDGDTGNNDPANVAILCRRCHMVIDGRMDRLIARVKAQAAERTHCKRGHELTGDNVKVFGPGHRQCKACQREYQREYQRQRRAALREAA